MTDWVYAQVMPAEELARLHHFAMKLRQPGGDVEFIITVREYASRNEAGMQFYAQADRPADFASAPYVPFGWGDTLLAALSECMRAIRKASPGATGTRA